MTTLIKALAQIAHDERCAIIMVHHVSKAGAKDEDSDAAMSRGAVAITDNARWVMAVSKMSAVAHERASLPGEAWEFLTDRLVKANYTKIGPVTILTRGAGGVLQPLPPTSERDLVAEIVADVHRDTETVYDDGEALDPRTDEPFPARPVVEKRPLRTAADLLADLNDDHAE